MTDVPRVPLAVVSMLTLLAVAGCGASDGTPTAGSAATVSRTPSPVASTTAATTPPTPRPTARTTAPPTTGSRPGHQGSAHKVGALGGAGSRGRAATADHLLAADRLPSIGGRAWVVKATDPDEGAAVGACQKTPLLSIGAVDAVRRTYTAANGVAATQVVGRFADARSAWRAHQVLAAWRDDCESRVADAAVGPLQPVAVEAGAGDSYRASFGRRPRAAGLGILRAGSYLTLVEVVASSERYPGSWDPARVAVRRIAQTF